MKTILLLLLSIPSIALPQKIMHEVATDNGKRAFLYDNGKWVYKVYEAAPSDFTDYIKPNGNDTLSGFFGIDFHEGINAVKNIMTQRGYSPMRETDAFLGYADVMFGGKESLILTFRFLDGKMYSGNVVFKPELESKTVALYNDIVEDINDKYFKGDSYEDYKYPYEKGDGHIETAIKLGKAEFSTYWPHMIGGAIMVEITPDHTIKLVYQDDLLIDRAIERQKERNLSDF